MKYLLLTFFASFSLMVFSEQWQITPHFTVTPSKNLDVTFQVFEAYDPNEKVIMGWKGEDHSYTMLTDLQPGGLKPEDYWGPFLKELKQSSDDKKINILNEQTTESGIELKLISQKSEGQEITMLYGLVVGQQHTYFVLGISVDGDNEYMQRSIAELLSTLSFSEAS